MSAVPPWRRLDPAGAPARLLAVGLALGVVALLTAAAALPLMDRIAQARADLAAQTAAVARLERAAAAPPPAAPDPRQAAAAARWLAQVAPTMAGDADAAALDLLSQAQTLAAQAGARVTSVAPLADVAALSADGASSPPPDPALGLIVAGVELRVVSDHAALTRLLRAAADAPGVRVVALETRARGPAPLAETDRLSTRLALAGLRRAPPGGAR